MGCCAPQNGSFGGLGCSQGGDLGVSVGFGGSVWGLLCLFGGSWGWRRGVMGCCAPQNGGFGGLGGSQGGDLGVSVGFVGWVWGLSHSFGVLEEVGGESWGDLGILGGGCTPKSGGFGVLIALRVRFGLEFRG